MPSAWRQGGLSYARRAIRHRGAAVSSGAWGFSGVCLTLALVACSSPSPPPIPPGVAQAASPIATAGAAASEPAAPSPQAPMLGASPTPRPAGRDLAFVRDGDIWLSNLGGTGSLQLTHDGRDSEPHWAPDGRRLLFLRGKGAEAELYSIGADGSELRRLSNDRLGEKNPPLGPPGGGDAY